MFGYAVPIDIMMSSKDASAYRGYYCETCHQLRDGYGVMSTVIVSYELTFASIILNSFVKDGVQIEKPKTGTLCVMRHGSVHTELMKKIAAYTILVANNDLIDDKLDGPSFKSNFGLIWMNHSIMKAQKDYPEFDRAILEGYELLREKEKSGCSDPIEMGETSAKSMVDVMRLINGDEWNEDLEQLFLNLGAWVYVMDAIDDLSEDWRNKQYNPFLVNCEEFPGAVPFIENNVYYISETLNTLVGRIQSAYAKLRPKMVHNVGIMDNVIYQGIPVSIRRVMSGNSKMRPKISDMVSGKLNRSIGSQF